MRGLVEEIGKGDGGERECSKQGVSADWKESGASVKQEEQRDACKSQDSEGHGGRSLCASETGVHGAILPEPMRNQRASAAREGANAAGAKARLQPLPALNRRRAQSRGSECSSSAAASWTKGRIILGYKSSPKLEGLDSGAYVLYNVQYRHIIV